ncbi:dual OB domain-containing protein [Sutcliffiella horikoshii]|uniref:dual OB domain-containing protein n=1 Tax=Sutcliffiella horikoshii TaxID=79883 RepID=UPI00384EEF51
MSIINFTVLAVTKTYDKYCIAGIDEDGNWLRPLPPDTSTKFWSNLFYNDNKKIMVGDVWEIYNHRAELDPNSPGHTEDIRLVDWDSYSLIKKLPNNELLQLVSKFQSGETELSETLQANGRSLCLIDIDSFRQVENLLRIKFTFNGIDYNNTTQTEGFPITDLKWRSYIQQKINTPNTYDSLYLVIGLARKEPRKDIYKEYPMAISLITDPEVPVLDSYPN